MQEKPSVYVFAGPNGAGKSTLATTILPRFLGVKDFVNADTIARGLSAFAPETVSIEAGRMMLKRLNELAAHRAHFAFESTLSSRSFAPYLTRLKAEGYDIQLFYVWVPSAEISISRIAGRVLEGGHHVPDDDVRRRYERSVSNMLNMYLPLADYAEIYHNDEGYVKVAEKKEGELILVGAEYMEIHYRTDPERMIDPTELNGFAKTQEASRLARPLAYEKAYNTAKFYGTMLAGADEQGRLTYLDPCKYSLDDIRAGRYKNDPSIYTPPAYISHLQLPLNDPVASV